MFELSTVKRIVILVILAICLYILCRLVIWRQKLLSVPARDIDTLLTTNTSSHKNEGFETMPTIRNTTNLDLPLKEYFIFSSWNTCWSGNAVSLRQLEKVMENGCRFLDFEVYNINGQPEIGYSTSGYQPSQTIPELESDTLPMYDVLNKIMELRSAGSVPNKHDPLLLHFRIKSDEMGLLEKMAESLISSGMADPLVLASNVTPDTLLSDLENKIVFIIDKSYVPKIKDKGCSTGCKTDIRKYISMYSSTGAFSTDKWEYLLNADVAKGEMPLKKDSEDDDRTNVSNLKMVVHHVGTEYVNRNENDFMTFILKHKVQIVPYKFFYDDTPLKDYKNYFSDAGHTAFITMAVAYDDLIQSADM